MRVHTRTFIDDTLANSVGQSTWPMRLIVIRRLKLERERKGGKLDRHVIIIKVTRIIIIMADRPTGPSSVAVSWPETKEDIQPNTAQRRHTRVRELPLKTKRETGFGIVSRFTGSKSERKKEKKSEKERDRERENKR